MKRNLQWIVLLAAILAGIALATRENPQRATTAATKETAASSKPLSDRIVEYRIDARYDASLKSLQGTETLIYQNKTGRPLDRFPFHLYLNAFQPDSTWMQESRRDDPGWEWHRSMRGSITVTSLEVEGSGDLTQEMQFISPDDGNPRDRTVMEVSLPKPLAPGESITFKIAFNSSFPEVVARTGYKGDFIMGAQWFPKVAVWRNDAWNAHQFHAATEFFADFGTYDVKLTLPDDLVVGATGVETARQKHPNGTQTISYHADDVIDFAWAADPKFILTEDEFSGAHRVKIRLLMLPDHVAQTARHMDALKRSIQAMEEWFGPYPYDQITVIDPAAEEAGGMEYPMLITAGTVWGMPRGVRMPESVVAHEFAHQYWYAVVATNEFEEPWLDEGLTSYSEVKLLERMFGRSGSYTDWLGLQLGARGYYWMSYAGQEQNDPISRSAVHKLDDESVYVTAYAKPALTFLTLENLMGEQAFLGALRRYYEEFKFRHPSGRDFVNTIQQSSAADLSWFLSQALDSTKKLDYAVSANSYELDQNDSKPLYRTDVVVERKGEFVFPVELEIAFENGEKIHEHWHGEDRWKRFTYDGGSELLFARIDPADKILLDQSKFNNSILAKNDRRATRKLTAYWIVAVQYLEQIIGWLS